MNKKIFKQPVFYLALFNFFIGLIFIFQDGILARIASYLFQLNFIFSMYILKNTENKK
ncbi:hypothetical protein LHA31_07675 [Carnobacterium viridans]|uniref:Uncharacterized protein n=1 Tax=Carnobacterium viridans TaxID=174587 RepID=A0A1H0ZSZ5_9LACT|nr:hypothetical protein [Carnobacterium viridans]UDE94488.1 hypothetical protein LHA31_07675 [Carnobacterium viridans]SDQ30381.1 hypothetical protein SAMN04487752_1693 [Carnobacterium viridans]